MKHLVRIGNGQGFWGDSIDAPVHLMEDGPLDYLRAEELFLPRMGQIVQIETSKKIRVIRG